MKRFSRPALSLVFGVIALCLLHHYPQTRGYINSLTAYLVFLMTAFLMIYCTATRRAYRALFAPRQTKTEYILSGSGKRTNQEYQPSAHPGFHQMERNKDGAVYCDEAGAVICTQYQFSEGPLLANPLLLWGECLVTALCGLLGCWLYVKLCETALFSLLLERVWQNISGLRALPYVMRSLLGRLVQNLQMCLDQIKANMDVDLSRIWEMLLQNLERR